MLTICNVLSIQSFTYCKSYIFLEQSEKTKGSSAVLMTFSTLQCPHDASLGKIPLSGREEQYLTDQVNIIMYLVKYKYRYVCEEYDNASFKHKPEHAIPSCLYMDSTTVHMYLCILEC